MDDLVVFLRARLAEEKAEAEKQPDDEDYGLKPWAVRWEETGEWNSYSYVRVAKARVLAEVEAKRGIIGLHQPAVGWDGNGHNGSVCVICAEVSQDGGRSGDPYPCETLRLLAAPYRDHPDFKPEWSTA